MPHSDTHLLDYHIGQRWVSHADAQLGLGIIVDIELRRVTVSFPAAGEERTYAKDGAPLTRLLFKVGDRISNIDQEELLVTSIENHQGRLLYTGIDQNNQQQTISELELNSFVQLTTPQQRLLNGHVDKDSDFLLRFATFEHLDRLQRSNAHGLMGSRTNLLNHQIYIANEVGKRYAPRVLLADEVGLGKTIEAGMIIHQQLLIGRAERVLILVPPSLLHQWLVEMLRRFNLPFSLLDEDRIANIEADNPFEAAQLVLCSLELFNDNQELQGLALAAKWDLCIVDEAHHLHWSPDNVGDDYSFIEALSKQTLGLLLLTATPEQIGQSSHFARLRLLDHSRFHDFNNFQQEEAGYRKLNELVELVEAGQRPDTLPQDINPTDSTNAIIKQLLDRHGTGRVLFRNTRAAIKGFPQRLLNRYPLLEPEQYNKTTAEISENIYPESNCDDENWLNFDPRVKWLEQTLKSLHPLKALVICAHAQTAKVLERHLHLRVGIRSTAFYEDLSIIERDRSAAYFADEEAGAQTLICSEIGSEGRNFQFAHHLILFDLPLNPDLLEQRIGRLDRIGQKQDIEIHVPYLEHTAQHTLLDWYDYGINLFRDSCSAGYAIYEVFQDRLTKELVNRTDDFEQLITDTVQFTQQTRIELLEGRDRLLERNSCKVEVAAKVIDEICKNENSEVLQSYLESLCDAYGVEHEFHSEHTLTLHPSDHMLTGHFPGLKEDGVTVTFDRNKALSREDMEFMTWEHPIVLESMEMVQTTELGNATIGTIKLKGIPPGTLLLETLYTINCVAPKALQIGRFLSLSPMRLLIDARGKDLAKIVSFERLNSLMQRVKKLTALEIIKQVHVEVETKVVASKQQAEQRLGDILINAEQNMRADLGEELLRLEALKAVNPSIRQEELDYLSYRIEESAAHIQQAGVQLQALRLIITT